MTEKEACALIERTLAYASADHTELVVTGGSGGSTRFANNGITQNVARADARLQIRSAFGNKVGSVRINRFDDDTLRASVKRSEDIARMSQPDTEYLPPPGPASFPQVRSWDEDTAASTPEQRADAVRAAIARAEAAGLSAAGSYATESAMLAVGNSSGLIAYHRETSARFVCTAMTPDSSGWAQAASWRSSAVDVAAAAERAVGKALASRSPDVAPPGDYTVVLEPAAVAEMLGYCAWSMDAKAADEGRSAFTGKLGQRIAGESVSLSSEPGNADCPGPPFFEDGMPASDVRWVDRGVLSNLIYTRFWAQKTGHAYTGRPSNLVMAGGEASVDDLVASTEDGILVTRFWYIRFVDPMKLLLTGMTRDGLFRIRGGQVAGGITNMRFNESPLTMLANTEMVGKALSLGGGRMAPPLKVAGFTFSSGTQF